MTEREGREGGREREIDRGRGGNEGERSKRALYFMIPEFHGDPLPLTLNKS